MKKIFLLLFVVFVSLCVNAQSKNYMTLKPSSVLQKCWNTDFKTINEMSDSLFSLLNKDYMRENYSYRGDYIIAFYPDEFDRDKDVPYVSFHFLKTTIDQNKDLGIEGKKVFRFSKIEGRFLDLYVIWEMLCKDFNIAPETKETITGKVIKKSEEIWWINESKQDCCIQLINKERGNPNKWEITYSVFVNKI